MLAGEQGRREPLEKTWQRVEAEKNGQVLQEKEMNAQMKMNGELEEKMRGYEPQKLKVENARGKAGLLVFLHSNVSSEVRVMQVEMEKEGRRSEREKPEKMKRAA